MAAAREVAEHHFGDPEIATVILAAYLNPDRAAEILFEETDGRLGWMVHEEGGRT